MAIEIVDLPSYNMVDLSSSFSGTVYQRLYHNYGDIIIIINIITTMIITMIITMVSHYYYHH